MTIRLTLLVIDTFLLYGTFLISYLIRYGGDIPLVNFRPFQESQIFLIGIIITSLLYAGVFRSRFRSYWLLFQRVAFGLVLGTAVSFVFMYLLRDRWVKFPSSVFLINFCVSVVTVFLINAFFLRLNRKIQKRVVVLGDTQFYDPFQKKNALLRIHHIKEIQELMNIREVDEIAICKRLDDNYNLNLMIFLLQMLNVKVTFNPAIYAELLAEKVDDDPMVHLFSTFIGYQTDSQEFLIRLLDIIISVVLLIGFAPILLMIASLIKLTSSGPVIYTQERVGKDGKLFTLYKFRTMVNNAESKEGPVLAKKNDPRVTKIGRFMRMTRLDEIPQLLNVLSGQMSLVGPRPERPHFVKLHRALRGIRLAVKPGLTGLAQVRNSYDLHPKHKIKYDYLYIQRRSLALNLYILYKTIWIVFMRKGQ